jgi:triosephosphate isomerase
MIPLIVGNWKANGLRAEARNLAGAIVQRILNKAASVELGLAPPFTALADVRQVIDNSAIKLAGQNCHWADNGAFTGEITAPMLVDLGCEMVIIGHSERRHIFNETDEAIAKKLEAALRHRLRPILCVGETLPERQAGQAAAVIERQLQAALKGLGQNAIENFEIAYEPVWAIGTGHNATSAQIRDIHARIREFLQRTFGSRSGETVRILYGGSVKPENAAEILRTPDVNGLLVGGASLQAETFLPIVYCLGEG